MEVSHAAAPQLLGKVQKRFLGKRLRRHGAVLASTPSNPTLRALAAALAKVPTMADTSSVLRG
jgi:hypothetical protein